MKNWKSTLAFFVFVGAYIYSLYTGKQDAIISTTGYIALYSSLFMMLRSDVTTDMLNNLINRINIGKTDA